MTATADLIIREGVEADMTALSAFMRGQGQLRSTGEYLRHWYFRNPTRGGTVILGEREGAVVGVATMNAHRFHRAGETALVAMPQKVLTAASLRGQGIFGRLYRASERSCLEKGADFFLTVTNRDSTDIFLSKFGYTRLPSPHLAVMLPRPGKVEASSLTTDDVPISTANLNGPAWCMAKDVSHHRWRFMDYPLKEYVGVRCSTDGRELGCVFLKRVKRKGVPVMLLLDILPRDIATSGDLLRAARKLAWKHRAFALICLQEERLMPAISANSPVIRRSSNFNFLAKGRDDSHTRALARQPVEISLGDLDFF